MVLCDSHVRMPPSTFVKVRREGMDGMDGMRSHEGTPTVHKLLSLDEDDTMSAMLSEEEGEGGYV